MISLLVPSRGRSADFVNMMVSAFSTKRGEVEIVARFDDDDDENQFLLDVGLWPLRMIVGPRSTLSSLWNECAVEANGEILMQCADDIRFRTPGWDLMVRDAFDSCPDRIAYVYGRDGIADERMATHGFMHRRWYEALGYFTWPEFSSDYGDLWNHTIAERLGRLHYIPELYTEHLHPSAGKGEWDQTHQERMARDAVDKNEDRWQAAQPDLEQAVWKLSAVLDVPLREQSPTDR